LGANPTSALGTWLVWIGWIKILIQLTFCDVDYEDLSIWDMGLGKLYMRFGLTVIRVKRERPD
jgi:hypothetical protein